MEPSAFTFMPIVMVLLAGMSVVVEPSAFVWVIVPSALTFTPIVIVRLSGMSVVVEPSAFVRVIVPSGLTMSLGASGLVGGVESDGPPL